MKLRELYESGHPTSEQVVDYINHNFYVYDEDGDTITIEDSTGKVRGKYEIYVGNDNIMVSPDYYGDKNADRTMKQRAKVIQREILKNAGTFQPSNVDEF